MIETKKKVYIFDCDGCIMPNLFQNYPLKEQSQKEREIIINDVIKNGLNTKLFPNFIRYYSKNCVNHTVIFITGRQRSEFKELTEKQLEPLKSINPHLIIDYYPKNRSHNPKEYFSWKINVIRMYINDERTKYLIFDDLDNYFKDLKYIFWYLKHLYFPFIFDVSYYKICSNKNWNDLI